MAEKRMWICPTLLKLWKVRRQRRMWGGQQMEWHTLPCCIDSLEIKKKLSLFKLHKKLLIRLKLPEPEGVGVSVRSRATAAGRKRPNPKSATAKDMMRALEGVRSLLKRSQTDKMSILDKTIRGLISKITIDRNEFSNMFENCLLLLLGHMLKDAKLCLHFQIWNLHI